jgi:hypothetical protein
MTRPRRAARPAAAGSATASPRPLPRPTAPALVRNLTGAGALVAIALYLFVSTAFTVPDNPARDAVQDVAAPYFDQRWRLFAPDIARVNVSLEVQAQWADEDGDPVESDWIDASHIELAAARGVPMPSRISNSSVNAIASYMGRFGELSAEQQDIAQGAFTIGDGAGVQVIPEDEIVADMGGADGAVTRYLRYDNMLARFATAMTEAVTGQSVEQVRWRAIYERPNDFVHRFDDAQYATSIQAFDWRRARNLPEGVDAIYDDVATRYGAQG